MDSKLVDPAHNQIEVLKRCLQGEEVPLDLQGVRERVLRIGRVGQVVGDEKGADLCARWLIAQLKVNLRPLWSPAAAALSLLAQRFGDLVWRLLFEELRKVTSDDLGIEDGLEGFLLEDDQHSKEGGGGDETSVGDPWEEERTWRDPSAHKLRSVVMIWEDPAGERKRLMKVRVVIHYFVVQQPNPATPFRKRPPTIDSTSPHMSISSSQHSANVHLWRRSTIANLYLTFCH